MKIEGEESDHKMILCIPTEVHARRVWHTHCPKCQGALILTRGEWTTCACGRVYSFGVRTLVLPALIEKFESPP